MVILREFGEYHFVRFLMPILVRSGTDNMGASLSAIATEESNEGVQPDDIHASVSSFGMSSPAVSRSLTMGNVQFWAQYDAGNSILHTLKAMSVRFSVEEEPPGSVNINTMLYGQIPNSPYQKTGGVFDSTFDFFINITIRRK